MISKDFTRITWIHFTQLGFFLGKTEQPATTMHGVKV